MTQQNKRNKIILGLVGAIGGSMLMGLPALAQQRSPDVYRDHTSPLNPNSPVYQRSGDSDSSVQDNSNSSVSEQSQNNDDSQRYNGNGLEKQPNNPNLSPDSDNPGLNQNPSQRLTPSNSNQNPGASSTDGAGYTGSDSGMNSGDATSSDTNQQQMNRGFSSQDNDNRTSLNQSSSVLNPCPSIFYEAKYRDTVGIPAGCPASYQGSSPAPSAGQ